MVETLSGMEDGVAPETRCKAGKLLGRREGGIFLFLCLLFMQQHCHAQQQCKVLLPSRHSMAVHIHITVICS